MHLESEHLLSVYTFSIVLLNKLSIYMHRTVACSLEVVQPYYVVITTTPTFVVQVPHKCGMAMAVPAL